MLLAAFIPTKNPEVSLDATLVNRLLQQDVSAFEQLCDRHSRAIYGLVLRILQQAGTAEEVVQDVFLQLWRNAGQYDSLRGPFLPWLFTSERQRRREEQTDELPPVALAPEYDTVLDEKPRVEKVRALMAALNPQQRRAIELAYFEGLSHTEIAAALSEPLGTVKSWIRNGLLRLKEGWQAR